MSQNDTVKESKLSLKTIYSILMEASGILTTPIEQLDYLNNGKADDKESKESSVSEASPTITLSMLDGLADKIRRKSSEVAKACNCLTGQ